MSAEVLLEQARLAELRRHMPEPVILELLRAMADDVSTRLTALDAAVDAADTEALRNTAHDLKSCSGNVGASALADIARDLEVSARAGRLDARLVAEVRSVARRTLDAVAVAVG